MSPRPPQKPLSVGQELDLYGHRWAVKGVHLGGIGQESLIHLEGLSHEPGWTGPWEFHPMLFVPEIMLAAAFGFQDRLSTPSVGEFLEATKGLTFFTAESGYVLVIGDGAPLRAAILSVEGGVK